MNDWRQRGACTDVDPDLMFVVGDGPAARAQIQEAKDVCARCPVRRECLEWVLSLPPQMGVWAGLTEQERDNLKQKRRRHFIRTAGKKPDPVVAERRRKVAAWASRGLSVSEISVMLGVSRYVVSADLQRLKAAA